MPYRVLPAQTKKAYQSSLVSPFFSDREGSESFASMTNVTSEELTSVWLRLGEYVERYWITGREKRSRTSGRDALFLALTVLKHE